MQVTTKRENGLHVSNAHLYPHPLLKKSDRHLQTYTTGLIAFGFLIEHENDLPQIWMHIYPATILQK